MKPHHKHIRPLLYAAIALLLTPLAFSCHRNQKPAGDAIPDINVAAVEVDSVTLTKSYPGYLKANKTVDVVARVNGFLLKQNFADGAKVTQGQVLFSIEPTQYADQVKEAQAQLATAESALEYATSHYAAVLEASKSNAVSHMELVQAESNKKQAEASVKSARSALETARTNLSYCTVTAPASGRITAATISVGAMVNGAGAPFTLATIYDDSSLDAVIDVEDSQHLRMLTSVRDSLGLDFAHIPLTFEQPLSRSYTGNLNYVAPEIDKSTGTIQLKAKVMNPNGELRDGMYVSVSVPYGFDPKAVLVKDASIGSDQLGSYVYAVNDSNRVVYTPIKIGEMANDSMRVVLSGLTPTSRYVTKALLKVRNGMKINPVSK